MNGWQYTRKPRVSEQRARATRAAQRLAKSRGEGGRAPSPVRIEGRTIARSFWGKAWCENLESYRDYEYRLPRGRSYVRSGAVLDLQIEPGRIAAVVAGSRAQPYEVEIRIKALAKAHWGRVKRQCAGQIGSLIELLEGRLSDRVMGFVTDREQGLFPKPGEIQMSCSCPDWATLCKHVAAVLYAVGSRLDAQPQLLFTLRDLQHEELLAATVDLEAPPRQGPRKTIATEDLSGIFRIQWEEAPRPPPAHTKGSVAKRKTRAKRRTVVKAAAGSGRGERVRSAAHSKGRTGRAKR